MTHRISKSQILAHIAAIADKSKVEDSDFLFFKDGIYKGEWNPNTSPNQLPTSKVPNAIYLVSENGSYFGKNLAIGELVRYDHDDKPILIYSKYLPISFFLSMLGDDLNVSDIKNIILDELQNNSSDLYTAVSSIATIGVIDTVNSAITNNQSDTYSFVKQASVDAFAIEMANNNSATYSSVYGTAIQSITDELQTGQIIDNAIQAAISN